jgi:hypothetical protein
VNAAGSRPRLDAARGVVLTIEGDVAGTELALAAPRPRRDMAVATISSMRGGAGVPALAPRAGLAEAVRAAIQTAVPYAGRGGELNAELSLEDTAPDGSRSAAHFRFQFHR